MFNHVLATLLGLTAIILGIVATIKFDLLCARQYDAATDSRTIKESVNRFLDRLDASREERYSNDRSRLIRQLDGYRHDWYAYEDEWACNFSMD